MLSYAAISAKKDGLNGLKENVIVGKPIPAGTGMRRFRNLIVLDKDHFEAHQARMAVLAEDTAE